MWGVSWDPNGRTSDLMHLAPPFRALAISIAVCLPKISLLVFGLVTAFRLTIPNALGSHRVRTQCEPSSTVPENLPPLGISWVL